MAAGLLALWMLASGAVMLLQWPALAQASRDALDQVRGQAALPQAPQHARSTDLVALLLKALAVPLLPWLRWRLGVPAVRAQFRSRR